MYRDEQWAQDPDRIGVDSEVLPSSGTWRRADTQKSVEASQKLPVAILSKQGEE